MVAIPLTQRELTRDMSTKMSILPDSSNRNRFYHQHPSHSFSLVHVLLLDLMTIPFYNLVIHLYISSDIRPFIV